MLVDASIRRIRAGDDDLLIILSNEQEKVSEIEGWTAKLPFGKKEDSLNTGGETPIVTV